MKRWLLFCIIVSLLLSSCSRDGSSVKTGEDKASFLSKHGIIIDVQRPYYSSTAVIPEIFDISWEIRSILSKDTFKTDLGKYRGKDCSIYMYPVSKLPFSVRKDSPIETRAVVICCGDRIVCSYIEFISELRSLPPASLNGKSLVELSGVDWETWKNRIDSDDDKRLVIWQYYDALRMGNYDEAYWYIYDKEKIKKEDFVNAAKESSLPYIDFLDIQQYKKPEEDKCYFIVRAVVGEGKSKKKKYEITFDLKRNSEEKEYGGWKILSTKIK